MQKFKATREEIMKAYKNIAGYDNTVWVLEGELLEGGMVEKCCPLCFSGALINEPWCGNKMCNCHKMEKCNHHRKFGQPCDICHNKKVDAHFNRETPKRDGCYPGHRCEEHKYKEEVKLPENIKIQPWNIYLEGSWQMNVSALGQKLNEVIDYLRASKENK